MNTIDFLNTLAHNLLHQHNRYTSYPIFMVQENVLITGLDLDYTENVGWFHCDGGSMAEGDEAAELEAKYDETGQVPEDWHRTGYDHRWMNVATFFTESAAEDYIKRQAHNHRGELRTYADSAYRNPELKELRRLLSGPVQECIAALRDVTAELQQLHAHHYGNCEGGCPAHSYIGKATAALNALTEFQDPYR